MNVRESSSVERIGQNVSEARRETGDQLCQLSSVAGVGHTGLEAPDELKCGVRIKAAI